MNILLYRMDHAMYSELMLLFFVVTMFLQRTEGMKNVGKHYSIKSYCGSEFVICTSLFLPSLLRQNRK